MTTDLDNLVAQADQAAPQPAPVTETPAAPVAEEPTPVEAQAPVQVPAPPPPVQAPAPPVTPPAPTAQEIDMLRRQNVELAAQAKQVAQVQAQSQAEAYVQAQAQQYVDQGLFTHEQSQLFASHLRQSAQQNLNLQQQMESQNTESQAKLAAIMHLSKQYGVDPQALVSYTTPELMQARAQDLARITQLESQVSVNAQAQVPVQSFDSNTGQAVESNNLFIQEYADGNRNSGADHIRAQKILSNL